MEDPGNRQRCRADKDADNKCRQQREASESNGQDAFGHMEYVLLAGRGSVDDVVPVGGGGKEGQPYAGTGW